MFVVKRVNSLQYSKLDPVFDYFTSSSLPYYKILDMTKFKAFADDKLRMVETVELVLDREENIVGKRSKCLLPTISSFPTIFSKGCFSWVVKTGIVL